MEHRILNDNFRAIAEDLIENELALRYLKDSRVRIAYLESDNAKKNGADLLVHGECEKVQAKNQWAIGYDYTITLYVKNNIGMSAEQIKILLFHELLHIEIDYGTDGGEVYGIKKHDFEDFRLIIDRFGADWADIAH